MARAQTVKSPWAGRDRVAEREAKREAVLHAAAQAFAEKGYHGTSLDDIASALGVTKPTLYYYSRNKDDLIIGASVKAMDEILATTDTDPHAPALVQLQSMLRRYAEVMMTDYGRCITVMRDARIGGEAGERLRDHLRTVDRWIRHLLETGMKDGSIAPCEPKLTTFVIAGAINSITRWYDEEGELSSAAIAERFVRQLTMGLAPR